MAKLVMKAGAEFDLLSPEEERANLKALAADLEDILKKDQPTGQRVTQATPTDASGNIGGGFAGTGAILYEVPVGYRAHVYRITFGLSSTTPASTLTAGAWGLYRNQPEMRNLFAFAPGMQNAATLVAPIVLYFGKESAQYLEGGERVVACASGLTASTTAVWYLQIGLYQLEGWDDPTRPRASRDHSLFSIGIGVDGNGSHAP